MYCVCVCTVYSLGGPQPYVPVGLDDDGNTSNAAAAGGSSRTAPNQRRARVLCSYDAKDATELNLTGNEVRTLKLASIISFWLTICFAGNFRCRMQSTKYGLHVRKAGTTQRTCATCFPRNSRWRRVDALLMSIVHVWRIWVLRFFVIGVYSSNSVSLNIH